MRRLTNILKMQQSALSAAVGDAGPVKELYACMAALLGAAASLVVAAKLLKQVDSSSAAPSDAEAAGAAVIAHLPMCLSLSFDALQGRTLAEVCCSLLQVFTKKIAYTSHLSVEPVLRSCTDSPRLRLMAVHSSLKDGSTEQNGKQGEAKGEAADWKLLQKPVRLLRAAAGSLTHLPQGTWMRLAALHIDCLKQLSAHMVVSCPNPCRNIP